MTNPRPRPASMPTPRPGPRADPPTLRDRNRGFFFSLDPVNFVNFRVNFGFLLALAIALIAAPAMARDSLGMFGTWGAFRDPAVPRCYAIAMAEPSARERTYQPYAAIGTWPSRGVRGQLHLRLSRAVAAGSPVVLALGGQRYTLSAGGGDAWTQDKRMDAAVIAAMRSAGSMSVSARDAAGRAFANTYPLAGAATAMDAAAVGCAPAR